MTAATARCPLPSEKTTGRPACAADDPAAALRDILRRIFAVAAAPRDEALAAIAAETEPQILTQARDVAKGDWRRAAIARRLQELTGN